ncbi:ExbD/TolR family protein [Granulicella cerasi]|uniref:ExbD/TolR family protein n=1 Tax=Granulicella cerasi TaxID=741063 RepID=A0ABW1ZBR4_9BACT|nr:biopolymer transporter ExbD [Granulicella cerasi]
MSAGSSGGAVASINVTPMIDVLLVLLIIFMVIQPTTPKGLEALVPQPPKNPQNHPPDNDRTIVVQVLGSGSGAPTYKINEQTVPREDLTSELTKIFATRQEKVMFVKGDKDLDFAPVAEAISFGKQADVTNIGLMTPQSEAGH